MRILWFIVAVLLFIVGILAYLLFTPVRPVPQAPVPSPQQEIPVATSTPGSSQTPAPLHGRVKVTSPEANATVGNTFEVAGEAPGTWYFEASFPLQVRNEEGTVLARTHAEAQKDWMTTEQVPFKATVTLDSFYSGAAVLILMRDNPSGLPENDDSLEIPVIIQ